MSFRTVVNEDVARSTTRLWKLGISKKASRASTIRAPIARRTMRQTPPITFGGPTRLGRQPASRVGMPKTLFKNGRYQGSRAASASSSELPQRRQKWRTGSFPSPHWPQIRSPGWRRVGASSVRGPERGRATVGATEMGRRDIGSSAGATVGGGAAATGAPTPASTGAGGGAVAWTGGAGGGAGGGWARSQ